MSDVLLERIAVALERIASNGPVGSGSASTGTVASGGATNTSGPATNTQAITNDMLVALVQPLVQEESTKEQVKAVLTKYGLNRLGEAKEDQYADLYREFTAIKEAPAPSSGDLI